MEHNSMDAKERAEDFFAKLILEENSEIRNGCIYLIARVIHEGMEYQKQIDAGIAKAHGSKDIAKAIENQIIDVPKPTGLFNKLFFWKK
jgi:hypothetical protein